nr:lipoprotein [uncultured Mediterranean phage uvMED]
MSKYIYNKDSFENAVEVNNYPWGFRFKTKRRTWIETDKNKGDRVCFCTLNPKTNKWCAVKKSTYNAVDVLLIDENNHIKSIGLWKSTSKEDLESFLSKIDYNSLSLLQKKQIERIKAINKVMEKVTFKIEKVSEYNLSDSKDLERMKQDNNSEETKKKEQEQRQIEGQIVSAINSTYNQALIKNNLK